MAAPGGVTPVSPPLAPPDPARTTFTKVDGDHGVARDTTFTLPRDSPIISSLAFLPWRLAAAPNPTSIARSSLVGTLLMGARRPVEDELVLLDAQPFVSTELSADFTSALAHAFDVEEAFGAIYPQMRDWRAATPGILAGMADSTPAQLTAAAFEDTQSFHTRAGDGPAELGFLFRLSVGQLLRKDDAADEREAPACTTLARATLF